MQKIFITLLLAAPFMVQAQGGSRTASVGVSVQRASHFYTTFDGFPVNQTKYSRLASGSPYLLENFMPANVILGTGAGYEGVRVRLNLIENELQFLNSQGMEMVTKVPMKQLVIRDTIRGGERILLHSIALPEGAPREGWYELLADGVMPLIKLDERRMITEKPFNSASEEQRIDSRTRYFVLKDGKYVEVKRTKDLASLFADRQKEMDAFLRSQKELELSWELEVSRALKHYNSLSAAAPAKPTF